MSEPTREEVQHFLKALQYGMKVTHKPEFLMALAEGWLKADGRQQGYNNFDTCMHEWLLSKEDKAGCDWYCPNCDHTVRRFDGEIPR